MNLAYVITAHKNPRQLKRLLAAIYHSSNVYVIHIDSKSPREMHNAGRELCQKFTNVRTIGSESIIWGSWKLAKVQIRGMAEALRMSGDWTYCLNLTAQDYPLRTQAEISEALAAGPAGANYLEVLDFAAASPGPRKRMEFFYVPWRGEMRKTLRRRPRADMKLFWGSNYFAFTRPACEHLVSSDVSRKMQRYFRFTICADEMIFQNAIMHSPLAETVVSKTFRKLVWSGGSHPKTFTTADREELLASDAWFARKFDDAVDANILDILDESLRSRAPALT